MLAKSQTQQKWCSHRKPPITCGIPAQHMPVCLTPCKQTSGFMNFVEIHHSLVVDLKATSTSQWALDHHRKSHRLAIGGTHDAPIQQPANRRARTRLSRVCRAAGNLSVAQMTHWRSRALHGFHRKTLHQSTGRLEKGSRRWLARKWCPFPCN